MRHCVFIILFVTTSIFCNSCKDEYNICNELKDVRFVASLYKNVGGVDVLNTATNFNLSILQGNVPIYTNEPNVSAFNMPLSVTLDSAKYIISFSNSLQKDTLTLIYTTQGATNISPNCPPLFFHNITRLYSTLNSVDSIKIINPILNTSLSQNAKIYF